MPRYFHFREQHLRQRLLPLSTSYCLKIETWQDFTTSWLKNVRESAVLHINDTSGKLSGSPWRACLNLSTGTPPPSEEQPKILICSACATKNWEGKKGDKSKILHGALEYFSSLGQYSQMIKIPVLFYNKQALCPMRNASPSIEPKSKCLPLSWFWFFIHWEEIRLEHLAGSIERETLDLRVVSLSPMLDIGIT